VDIWDLIRIMARRWYVVLVVAAATVGVAVLTSSHVQGQYKAVGTTVVVGKAGSKASGTDNPWSDLGLTNTAAAISSALDDPSFKTDLRTRGLSTQFTIIPRDGTPIVDVTATSTSPEVATKTADYLLTALRTDLDSRQTALSVASADKIVFETLSSPNDAGATGSGTKRAVGSVAAIGLLAAVALSLAVDGLATRRGSRKRRSAEYAAPAVA
jgi:capsular polysaccharide biosynthesis protein